ncbi:MAG: hypothetical protein B7Y11_04145, partial [Sphingobacteriia bacterium 24-36-13]
MEYLVKDKKLELKYQPGKGAWTYHIQVPNTKHIVGKWGFMKVAGTIDNYTIESLNLAKLGDQDKLISINSEIRKAINKTGGDTVTVTLYLLTSKEVGEDIFLKPVRRGIPRYSSALSDMVAQAR